MVCVIHFRLICSRRGKALRLSYDHKGTDEAEGRRIAAAGGLILNSRVNGYSLTLVLCQVFLQ
jgi:serine/threonine protein phosphatase PrpC